MQPKNESLLSEQANPPDAGGKTVKSRQIWRPRPDSNRQPADPKSSPGAFYYVDCVYCAIYGGYVYGIPHM